MSSGLLLFLTIVILGILGAFAVLVFNRWFDGRESEPDDSELPYGLMGPYSEIRKTVASETPRHTERPELAMTPNDVIMLIDGLIGEVNNGGFDQFFFNSTGDYALETIEALKRVGATEIEEIFKSACNRFPDGVPPQSIYLRRDLMLKTVSPEGDAFGELDELYYSKEETLGEPLRAFKEKHSL